jgi:hypothetical protein
MVEISVVDPDPYPYAGSASASNKNPDPHQIDQLDPEPDPHQFADDKSKSMEYEPILALFQGFDHLFGS